MDPKDPEGSVGERKRLDSKHTEAHGLSHAPRRPGTRFGDGVYRGGLSTAPSRSSPGSSGRALAVSRVTRTTVGPNIANIGTKLTNQTRKRNRIVSLMSSSGAPQVKKSKWDDMDDDPTPTGQKTTTSSRPSKRSRKAALTGVNVSRSASPHKTSTPTSHRTTATTTTSEDPPPIQSTSSDASHLNPSYLNGSQQPKKAGISILGRASLPKKGLPPNRSKQIRELHPPIQGCRSVYCYESHPSTDTVTDRSGRSFYRLNHIEEGSYGVVFRARDKDTGEIVALKKIKMDQEKNGFPITSLREIHTLMMARHENIVHVREIVVGDTLTQIFIVMDFIEHDLKTLLSTMRTPFLASEVKTILLQLLSATALCHNNWIIHRDLKTSNLLMNNRGQVKVADFGLARTYGDPPMGDMTQLVVTLWYRAPELLLGAESYTTAIDLWSIGCIFAELILREPIFPGAGEIDQIGKIFKLLGRPTDEIWPGFKSLPNALKFDLNAIQPYSTLRQKFRYVTESGMDLMNKLLTYDPLQRISADEALKHPYFKRITHAISVINLLNFIFSETPLPKHPDAFQSFPSIAAGEKAKFDSPSAPHRDEDRAQNNRYDLIL
ncbi:hypothetical protein PSHT_01166 [Puccinia striiformis]|nr:CMGC/CDK protein kinase [Puccinia striiformis f. sp. tritici PST-78]POW22524.1 hypothetical protein PSHT_01166 [Puccinia striiformis]